MLNDQAQAEAAGTINAVYGSVKREILIVVGVLFLLALATGLYTLQANRKTFEKLQHLADQLRLQSEQLRRLSWKLIEVQEETLRQVSRDLHDEFGQILTAIGALLSRAGRKSTDMALLQDLDLVKTIVQDTLQKVRDQSQMFRPAILDDFGLEQTLEWFVAQFSRQTAIKVHLEGEITEVRVNTLSEDSRSAVPQEQLLAITVNFTWKDLRTGEILSQPRPPATANTSIPLIPAPTGTPGTPVPESPDGTIRPPEYVPPGAPIGPPVTPPPVLVQSIASFIPELGESITTAQQKNVNRLAIQIVSMMESPW